ncbi:TrkH family potassium uptake protein [Rhodobacterales bacterium HKCCE3408]|nr:TrkH family potassium uptake protein [Rhodobacterales bacterium HKCCE3408]
MTARARSRGRVALRLPLLVMLVCIAAVAMMVPAAVASLGDYDREARAFFYTSLLVLVVAGLAAIAAQGTRPARTAAAQLIGLFAAYLLLPAVLALPVVEAVRDTRFLNAYFDMLSCLTTTGAEIYEVDRLIPAVHLWRGLVGWLGGFMIWVTAMAVLAPLNLGGYEVSSEARLHGEIMLPSGETWATDQRQRLARTISRLAPIYIGLTMVLWVLLVMSGQGPLISAIHAMSTLSTSGISPLQDGHGGVLPEALIALFLFFALSRRTFTSGVGHEFLTRIQRDREVRLAAFAIVVLTALMFLRHWVGALEIDELGNPVAALSALWGTFFTVLSFLTTTGFVSEHWEAARAWSGLPTPGMPLIGLCLMGGGVATTAGGIKLMRVYALYKHGAREIGKLVHPNSVASAGRLGRRIRREGAYIAWIFFMLFTIALAVMMALLALAGLDFEASMVLAISALTTTGQLADVAAEVPIDYAIMSDPAKVILAAGMIIGRLETLVVIALLNPAFWRG